MDGNGIGDGCVMTLKTVSAYPLFGLVLSSIITTFTRAGDCYTSIDWSHPGRTIDFGVNSVTASVSDWHNNLQITASHPEGLVYVRGDPDQPGSILARAQDDRGRGSWGFGISSSSQIEVNIRHPQALDTFDDYINSKVGFSNSEANEMMHLQPCLDPVERECLLERHFAEQHRSRALS